MKSMAWKFIVITTAIFLFCSYAFADGPSAWLNLNYTETKQYEDGERTQTTDSLFQNYYFRFNKSVTPMISYQLYLRANLNNSHTTDAEGDTTDTYQRAIEPALDLLLHGPVYKLDIGTRRLEQWSTANLQDSGRRTTEFYYSRLHITPYELPSASLEFNREKVYDYLSPRDTDITTNRYRGSSWYDLLYKGFKLSYTLTYTHDETKTPLDTISKTIRDDFNALYSIGYSTSFWGNSLATSLGYQGNYVRNRNEQHATETGDVPFERASAFGMYGLGTQIEPEIDELISVISLNDDILDVPASSSSGTINIGQNGSRFHNIGIQLFSSERPVDTLYIYVNRDVTSDMNLININNWRIYRSDFNQPNTWTEVSIQSVTVSVFSTVNNVYRYEIRFITPQNGLFFRAINMDTASVNDVLVTEIEAFGTDFIPRSGKIIDTSTFFTHGINFNLNARPLRVLTVSLNYFLNRTDQNPDSELDSISGAFKSIFTKTIDENGPDLRSNITRSYGVSTIWLTHRLLTTTARYQRNESFDNMDETDLKTDTYSLTLNSTPLPTLDTNLSFIRTYSYSFGEKQSIGNLYLLTIGSRLHRDVNIITDIGYTKTKMYAIEDISDTTGETEDTDTSTRYIRGMLDARLTNKLSANLTYGLTTISGESSSDSTDGNFIVTYRPGRFISFSANLRFMDTDGDTTISEGILFDWLFLPTLRINANYQHSREEPGPRTTHLVNGYFLWYITKFLDFQFTYSYSREEEDIDKDTYTFGGNLTCRFW